jgi:hypothetical protein
LQAQTVFDHLAALVVAARPVAAGILALHQGRLKASLELRISAVIWA